MPRFEDNGANPQPTTDAPPATQPDGSVLSTDDEVKGQRAFDDEDEPEADIDESTVEDEPLSEHDDHRQDDVESFEAELGAV